MSNPNQPSSHRGLAARVPDPSDAHVLLVEDQAHESKILLAAFKAQGFRHRITVCSDGVDALDYLLGKGPYNERGTPPPPALILLDLRMPKLDGIEVLRRLREDKWLKYVPVIVFTGSADDEKRLSALDLGAKFVIEKPRTLDAYFRLAAQIDNLLSFIR